MRKVISILVVLAFVMIPVCVVLAEEAPAAPAATAEAPKVETPKAEAPVQPKLEEMTLQGTITKVEKKTEKGTHTAYVLTDKEGNEVRLPRAHKAVAKEGEKTEEAAAINPADYVGVEVKLVGLGATSEKDGKKRTYISKIISIEKIASEKPAEAEKAPAEATKGAL